MVLYQNNGDRKKEERCFVEVVAKRSQLRQNSVPDAV
jgi:hypothetical protein